MSPNAQATNSTIMSSGSRSSMPSRWRAARPCRCRAGSPPRAFRSACNWWRHRAARPGFSPAPGGWRRYWACAARRRSTRGRRSKDHRHSGARLLARARNPYSRSWLWIPGSLASLAPRNDGSFCSRALLRKMCGKRLAQFDLAQFAGRGHRHFIQDPDEFRHLEAAEVLAAMFRYGGLVGYRARLQLDKGRYRLAPLRMRQADHGGVLHGGMGEQRLLDLDGSDVLAARLDHVLLAIEEQHFAVLVDDSQIAGVMPAEFARLLGRLRVLVIAHHDIRPAVHQFTGLPWWQQ